MPIRKNLAVTAIAALAVTGVGATAGTAAAAPPAGTPLGSYIVTLAPGNVPSQVAGQAAARLGGRVGHVYTAALNGFAVTLPAAAGRPAEHPARRRRRGAGPAGPGDRRRAGATWGLDRIDQRTAAAERQLHLHRHRRRRDRLHHRHRHPSRPHRLRRPGDAAATTRSTAAAPTTATATARTSPARSAARRTASPRRRAWSPSGCSTAPAAGSNSGVIAGIDWVTADHQPVSRRWPT